MSGHDSLFHFSSGNVAGKGRIWAPRARKNHAADLTAPSRCEAGGRRNVSAAGLDIGYALADQRERRAAGANQVRSGNRARPELVKIHAGPDPSRLLKSSRRREGKDIRAAPSKEERPTRPDRETTVEGNSLQRGTDPTKRY